MHVTSILMKGLNKLITVSHHPINVSQTLEESILWRHASNLWRHTSIVVTKLTCHTCKLWRNKHVTHESCEQINVSHTYRVTSFIYRVTSYIYRVTKWTCHTCIVWRNERVTHISCDVTLLSCDEMNASRIYRVTKLMCHASLLWGN